MGKDSVMIRLGTKRLKIAGDSYMQLMELCEDQDREPTDMVRILIKKEHGRKNRKAKR